MPVIKENTSNRELVELLNSDDAAVQIEAVRVLALTIKKRSDLDKEECDKATEPLVRMLDSEDESVKQNAVIVLTALATTQACKVMVEHKVVRRIFHLGGAFTREATILAAKIVEQVPDSIKDLYHEDPERKFEDVRHLSSACNDKFKYNDNDAYKENVISAAAVLIARLVECDPGNCDRILEKFYGIDLFFKLLSSENSEYQSNAVDVLQVIAEHSETYRNHHILFDAVDDMLYIAKAGDEAAQAKAVKFLVTLRPRMLAELSSPNLDVKEAESIIDALTFLSRREDSDIVGSVRRDVAKIPPSVKGSLNDLYVECLKWRVGLIKDMPINLIVTAYLSTRRPATKMCAASVLEYLNKKIGGAECQRRGGARATADERVIRSLVDILRACPDDEQVQTCVVRVLNDVVKDDCSYDKKCREQIKFLAGSEPCLVAAIAANERMASKELKSITRGIKHDRSSVLTRLVDRIIEGDDGPQELRAPARLDTGSEEGNGAGAEDTSYAKPEWRNRPKSQPPSAAAKDPLMKAAMQGRLPMV